MKPRPLLDYKDIHAGKDIYIIASGSSMDFMPKSFFDGKITIGLNYMFRFFPCKYTFFKDIYNEKQFKIIIEEVLKSKLNIIFPHEHRGVEINFKNAEYISAPVDRWDGFVNPKCIGTDIMVNSHLSITTAIHIAYYMGAANIILVGADCGTIDGNVSMDGYYGKYVKNDLQGRIVSHPYNEFNITVMRDVLKERGCNVVSLCPFVNIGLEGHKYSKRDIPETELWAGPTSNIHLT